VILDRRSFLAALLQPAPPKAKKQEPSERPGEIPSIPPARASESPLTPAKSRWRPVFEFDEMDRSVVFNDCRFATADRGIAAGLVTNHRSGSTDGYAVLTRNGGEQWTPLKIKDAPLTLFWGPNAALWMVGEEDLWYSAEAGLVWEKRKLPSGARILRVHFLDDQRGWAYGAGKHFFYTGDGGRKWDKVPESASLDLRDEYTSWSALQFITPEVALMVGNFVPPRRDRQRFPDWMNPQDAIGRRLIPTTTLAAETRDGGKTWKIHRSSSFGNVVRLRVSGNRGLLVYHYNNTFEFPSEVMEVDFSTGKSWPIFRRKDILVYDAVPLAGGGAVLAGFTVPPAMAFLPVSRPLTIVWSDNDQDWIRQRVHYRAAGKRAILAAVSSAHMWCATDEGMILKLIREG
jgi:hypothetical protein